MKTIKKKILGYVIEFLIVAFGVFLGIYVSELQNQKKANDKKIKTINYIKEELSNNKNNLIKSIEYHELIKINFDSLIRTLTEEDVYLPYFENEKFKHNKIKGWKGFRLADLEDVAFEVSKTGSMVQEIDIESKHTISKIYKEQKKYSEFAKSTLERMFNVNSSTITIDVISTFQLFTNDVLNQEKLLLTQIEKGIEKL